MASTTPFLSFFILFFLVLLSFGGEYAVGLTEINLGDVSHGFPSLQVSGNSAAHGNGGNTFYERVHFVGLSRFKVKSYASSFHVMIKASDDISERYQNKMEFCLHGNASLGLGQCKTDDLSGLKNGQWAAVISPYGDKYLDVKFPGVSGSLMVSAEEEFQQWRLIFLALGIVLLMLAPIVSSWVPFYYSSSMVLGVLLVVLIILFQGMKLLPTGRKSFLYLTLYGSIVGAGSFLVHYFSVMVNSLLLNFGLHEEMHNPVSVFLLVGITLSGAALGYWVVRKFVLSSDGTVDAGIAQFVKWAMRIFAFVFILQSTLDTILAIAATAIFWIARSAISLGIRRLRSAKKGDLWLPDAKQVNRKRAEFLSRSPEMGLTKHHFSGSVGPFVGAGSPSNAVMYSTACKRGRRDRQADYYSSFHKMPLRRRFSRKEWDSLTRDSTREALAELAATADFSTWMAENAHRIHLSPEPSSGDSAESSSDSSDATTAGDSSEDTLGGFFGRFLPH